MSKNKLPPKVEEIKFKYSFEMFISTLLTAFIMISAIALLINIKDEIFYTDLMFQQQAITGSSFVLYILGMLCIAGLLTFAEYMFPSHRITAYSMLISSVIFSVILMKNDTEFKYYTWLAVMGVMALIILYTTKKGCYDFIKYNFDKRIMFGIVGAVGVLCVFFVGAASVYRYFSYSTPNFDFGLFCNMFYNMKETGLPTVSCERDQILSHFAVHFSPIYYLMLPFFYIFPHPATLQILQVIVLYSGIIPLMLLGRKKGLSNKALTVLGVMFVLSPAVGAGTFYDLHENCFLVPLLLWVFYLYESKKYIPMSIFCVLTLLVKEDAFMYLIFFAIYILISDKQWKFSLGIAVFSIAYFLVVSSLMEKYGTGIMSDRYSNFIYNDDGLLGAIKTVIINPGYALGELFVANDGGTGKILYLLQIFLPLGLIPFATKKLERFLLLCPLLLNLLTWYPYQPDIQFQYTFGSLAFVFYATALNMSELSGFVKKYLVQIGAVAAITLFALICIPRFGTYYNRYNDFKAVYDKYDYALEEVLPNDASVTASSFLIAHIADREEIYEVRYHVNDDGTYKTDTEYVVLDMRYTEESGKAHEFYTQNGYTEIYRDGDYVSILKKSN